MTRFDYCVAFVLSHETEYDSHGNVLTEHDPHDPGGTTRYGIDQRSHPKVDVEHLTEEEAKQIYHDCEWTRCRCDELPVGWDLAVFDTAVNIGSQRTIKMMQRAVGVKQDEIIGPMTLEAVKSADVAQFIDLRETYYRSLPDRLKNRYLKGWLNRVSDVRKQTEGSQAA